MTFVAYAQLRGLRATINVANGVRAPCASATPPVHAEVVPTGAYPYGVQPQGRCATWVPEPLGTDLPNHVAQLGLTIIGYLSANCPNTMGWWLWLRSECKLVSYAPRLVRWTALEALGFI